MQLAEGTNSVRCRLIAASCALLGASAARSQSQALSYIEREAKDWQLQSALAYYHENGRIQAIEPLVSASREYEDGGALQVEMIFDSLSGSSPNGASPSRLPQTFASPSARSFSLAKHRYTVAPGQLPVDPNYHDARFALDVDRTVALTRLMRADFGGKLSYEDDFYSLSVNAGLARDFNERNTTLSLSIEDENDRLQPIGGAPVPLSDYALFEKRNHESKNGVGALAGVTQVMSRAWLSQLNLSIDRFTGYLADPYKIVSIVDPSGSPVGYIYENRPDSRTRRSAYWDNRVAGARSSADLSIRYMTDTWGVRSDTAQLRVRWWNPARDSYLEPAARWYRQSAADFFKPWVVAGGPPDEQVSADSRLGAFHAMTYGLKYGHSLSDRWGRPGAEFSVRLEYYQQTNRNEPATPLLLQGLDLFPALRAVLIQFGISY